MSSTNYTYPLLSGKGLHDEYQVFDLLLLATREKLSVAKYPEAAVKETEEPLISEKDNSYLFEKLGPSYTSEPTFMEEIPGTVSYDVFKTVVKYEIEQIRQTACSSNLLAFSISHTANPAEVKAAVLKQVVSTIRSSIRSSDMIAFYSPEIILVTMNDIPHKVVITIAKDIISLLRKQIAGDFTNPQLEINGKILKLKAGIHSGLQQIHQLIDKL